MYNYYLNLLSEVISIVVGLVGAGSGFFSHRFSISAWLSNNKPFYTFNRWVISAVRHHTIIGGRALVVDGRIALTRYSIVIVTLIIMHCRNETVDIFLAVMVYVLMYTIPSFFTILSI